MSREERKALFDKCKEIVKKILHDQKIDYVPLPYRKKRDKDLK